LNLANRFVATSAIASVVCDVSCHCKGQTYVIMCESALFISGHELQDSQFTANRLDGRR